MQRRIRESDIPRRLGGGGEKGWWRWCHPRTATPEISSKGKRGASYRTMEQATQARVKYRYAAYQPFLKSLNFLFFFIHSAIAFVIRSSSPIVMCASFFRLITAFPTNSVIYARGIIPYHKRRGWRVRGSRCWFPAAGKSSHGCS